MAISAAPPGSAPVSPAAAALGLTIAALAACGSDDAARASTEPDRGEQLGRTRRGCSLSHRDRRRLQHQPGRKHRAAGTYEIEVRNEGGSLHNPLDRAGREHDGRTDGDIPPGDSGTFTVTLEPGESVFVCSVANHRSMGMETTVEVTP